MAEAIRHEVLKGKPEALAEQLERWGGGGEGTEAICEVGVEASVQAGRT